MSHLTGCNNLARFLFVAKFYFLRALQNMSQVGGSVIGEMMRRILVGGIPRRSIRNFD